MMPWRAIQDTVPFSESLAELSDFAERLYWRLVARSDPWGRLPGSSRKIRALCVPLLEVSDDQVTAALEELEQVGRVKRYTNSSVFTLQIEGFEENQPAEFRRRRGASSAFPAYTDLLPESSGELPHNNGFRPETASPEVEGEGEVHTPNGVSSKTVRTVYDYWREARGRSHGRYSTMTPKRAQKIRSRLREFSVEELCRAVDGVALDSWEERPHQDDITIIFKSTEQVQKFLALTETAPVGSAPDEDAWRSRVAEFDRQRGAVDA